MKKVHITQEQRYEIAAYLRAGFSQAEIARLLNKSRSVICMEVNRNRNSRGHYSGGDAEMFSRMRKEKKRSPKGKDSKTVARLVVQMLMPFSDHVLSITTDNGPEFADHKTIARKLHTAVYFAHPYSSWEKGLVENTNKLIRHFIPKGTDFSSLSDDYLLHVQTVINRRPRKLLNFFSPKQIFLLSLHNSVAL